MRVVALFLFALATAAFAKPEAREWTASDGTQIRYRWSEPEAPEEGRVYPVILFLHGAGERGEDNAAQLRHGVPDILKHAKALGEPVFLIAPQCPQGRWWAKPDKSKKALAAAGEPDALLDGVLELVEETFRNHPADRSRFYVTGISMGGFATWDMLARAPEKIAAAIPVCGGGDPETAERFKAIPIWAFHGEDDNVISVDGTRDMIAALEKAGGEPKATYYPGVAHNSWTRTYRNRDVIEWLLGQRLPER